MSQFYNAGFTCPTPWLKGGAAFVGALDAYAGGLGGAYSVRRRLLASYDGALLRVRRSSDSTELDIGFTATGAVNVSDFSAFVGGGTGYVVKIYDQSGNGFDKAQSSGSAQPVITMSGSGSDAAYACTVAKSLVIPSMNPQLLVGSSEGVIILKLNPAGSTGRPLAGVSNATLNIWATNGGTIYFDYGGFTSGRNSVSAPGGWANNWHWLRCQRVDKTQKIIVDGSTLKTDTLSATIDGTAQAIYLPQDFVGSMSEEVCWTDGNNADAREAALMA